MRSMTGYGKATGEAGGREITIELKSVNHRFLDLNVKMPKMFNSFEDAVRKTIADNVARGHIDVYVNCKDKSEKHKEVEVDLALAKALQTAAKTLETELGLRNDVSVLTLLKSDGVVKITEGDEEGGAWKDLFLSVLNSACSQLNAMREYEGKELKADLTARIAEAEALAKQIDGQKSAVAEEYAGKLKIKIKEALEGVAFDEARFLNEVAYFVDRSSIDEETARLFGHIAHFRKTLSEAGAVGKQLDFLVQELNREANTICSKSNNAQMTSLGLKLKNEIEKIREQVQNAE